MSALFYYKIVLITELLVAEFLISFRKKKRRLFALRLIGALLLVYAGVILFALPDSVADTGWYSCIMFLSFFAASMLLLKFVYKISWPNVLFVAIVAYTIKHLSYAIFSLIGAATNLYSVVNMYSTAPIEGGPDASTTLIMLLYLSTYIFFYTVLYFVIGQRINRAEELRLKLPHLLFMSAFALLVDIVLNSFVIYDLETRSVLGIVIDCCFNILSCMLVLYVQLNLIEIKEVEGENRTITRMLRQAQSQYEFHQTNFELINIKCHDIKHAIGAILSKNNFDRAEVEKINDVVSIYDTLVKTGNKALDILLTEKSLVCKNKHITLTCMVDCKDLSFIRESDLYVLFGNLMDNAIEAVSKIDDSKNRCITLNIHTVKRFVTISLRNYFNGEVIFADDGFPRTTKGDSDYHGYGMKSIKMIVENYRGNLSVAAEKNVFKVNILFPLGKEQAQ